MEEHGHLVHYRYEGQLVHVIQEPQQIPQIWQHELSALPFGCSYLCGLLGWFRKAEELGSVVAACKFYGLPRRTYYYWNKRSLESNKQLTSLYDLPRTPKSHKADTDAELVSLIVQLRLGLGYGEDALCHVLKRDYGVTVSHHGVGNVLKRAGLLEKRKPRVRKGRQLSGGQYYPGEVGQMDVKHWKRKGYQYDLIDCATRIKYKP